MLKRIYGSCGENNTFFISHRSNWFLFKQENLLDLKQKTIGFFGQIFRGDVIDSIT